jgi:RES domain-containing protein
MLLFRLARRVYPPLDGEGARLYGGRWNSPGAPAAYAASHLSLAVLELLVHTDPDTLPADLVAHTVEAPDDLPAERVDAASLPPDWREVPDHPACRALGDAWLAAARTPLLAVPSAVVPEETNWLLNPRHPAAARVRAVRARPFSFDARLLTRAR